MLYFSHCAFIQFEKPLVCPWEKRLQKPLWNKPRIKQQSPSKQSIQATFLPQLTGLTLFLPQAPHAPNPKATSFCQTAAAKASNPQSHSAAMERWNYSLKQAGFTLCQQAVGAGWAAAGAGALGRDQPGARGHRSPALRPPPKLAPKHLKRQTKQLCSRVLLSASQKLEACWSRRKNSACKQRCSF